MPSKHRTCLYCGKHYTSYKLLCVQCSNALGTRFIVRRCAWWKCKKIIIRNTKNGGPNHQTEWFCNASHNRAHKFNKPGPEEFAAAREHKIEFLDKLTPDGLVIRQEIGRRVLVRREGGAGRRRLT